MKHTKQELSLKAWVDLGGGELRQNIFFLRIWTFHIKLKEATHVTT